MPSFFLVVIIVIFLFYGRTGLGRAKIRRKISKIFYYLYRHDLETLSLLVIAVILLYMLKIQVGNDRAILGVDLGAYEKEIESLRLERVFLKQEIYESSSLRTLEAKAKDQGFIPCDNCEIIIENE